MLTLARRMGLTVIAEGVETADQDELLREMGCPVVQGYLYGRPVPPAEVLLPEAVLPPAVTSDAPRSSGLLGRRVAAVSPDRVEQQLRDERL